MLSTFKITRKDTDEPRLTAVNSAYLHSKNYFFNNTCIIFQYLMYWHHNELFGNVCLVVILCKIIFCVCLNQGGKSRDKVVKILVSVTPDEILEKLKKEAST